MTTLSMQHITTLCKYTGISFIAGAVTHGAFSEQRSLLTAGIGVVLFVSSLALERRGSQTSTGEWLKALLLGVATAVSLGFFTGGIQHFPDSPLRSAWVVPLGFVMSYVALVLSSDSELVKDTKAWIYGLVASGVVAMFSFGAATWLGTGDAHGEHGGHQHGGHNHGDSGTPVGQKADTKKASIDAKYLAELDTATRTVTLSVDDTMRFTPQLWTATQGEKLRIVLTNKGKLPHELVIGTQLEVETHAKDMAKDMTNAAGNPKANHHHQHSNAISVAPGQTKETIWIFDKAGTFTIGCLIGGHFEAGMRGLIEVGPASGKPKT